MSREGFSAEAKERFSTSLPNCEKAHRLLHALLEGLELGFAHATLHFGVLCSYALAIDHRLAKLNSLAKAG